MCNKARTTASLGLFGLRSFAFAPAAIIAIAVTNSLAVIRIGVALAEAEMTNRKITIIASLGKAELQRGAAIKA
jgi:hypothetical protein